MLRKTSPSPPSKMFRPDGTPFVMDDASVDFLQPPEAAANSVPSRISGCGESLCWLLQKNKTSLRVWRMLDSAHTSVTRDIPYFTSIRDDAPVFVSEMLGEDSLAFCTRRGVVSSLDRSVEFAMEDNYYIEVTAFTCKRRLDMGEAIVTAIGSQEGKVHIGVKRNGEHFAALFDPATASCEAVNITHKPHSPGLFASILSLVKGERSSEGIVDGHSEVTYGASTPITHLRLRNYYGSELIVVNESGNVFLVDIGPVIHDGDNLSVRWGCCVPDLLQRRGKVVAVGESRHKVCVLFHALPENERDIPSLIFVTLSSDTGNMIYYTTIDTIVDVVSYISTALPDRVKLFIDDAHETVSVLLAGPYCVRINNQADTRNPCENTIVMRRFGQVLDSTVLPDGAVVSLVASGPVKTIRDIFSPNVELLHPAHSMDDSYTGTSRSEVDIEQIVKQILDEPQRRKYDMDDAVTAESENIYTQKDVYHYNWARSFDLFSEERNVIAYVTKELRLRQQHHRQFLLSILKACRGAPLLPSTMATLLSAQEAMLCLVSLRELQNIGSLSDVDAISKFTATYLLNDEKESRLLRSAAQLEAAQLIIRRSIVSIAKNIKEAREDDTFISNATAVEIFYSTPDHVVLLLLEIVKWYKEFLVSVVDLREKVLMTEALCGVVLIIIGTIQKSRSDLRSLADTSFWKGCWTNTGDDRSLGTLLNRLCILLCDGLQDFLTLPAMLSQRPVPATEQSHQHMLEHIVFIMDFILRNHSLLYQENQQSAFFSSFIRETLFRKVYIENADIGYPFGSPRANASSPLNKAIIGYCEEFSYAYLAKELISCFCLAEPVERPLDEVHQYEKLQYYCRKDPRVVELTFAYLLDAGRHFELVNLPSLLPSCEGVNDQLLRFLRSNAPHLEWLAQHDSFESILCQGRMAQPNLPYGTTALESKGRTLSVAWLSYASIPSCEPSRISSLLLETECVEAQNTFLRGCHCISDYREMIQSLLSLDSVDAWVKAARIGVLVEGSIGDDLCSQVLRRCTQQDGDVALQIRQDAMSEKEMATRLSATALGKVICACPRLRDHNNLHRLTLSFLSTEILKVMCDFVDYYFLTDNKYNSIR